MVTTSTQWWEIGLFTCVDEGLSQPDLMMHYGSVPFDMNTLRRGYPTTDNGFCLTPNVTQGRSRGTVRLRSLDYRDRPRVDPRYFTDPDGYDERIMLAGIRLARKIAEQAPLKDWIARELAPGPDATTDDELLDYVHQTHNTVYHPAATARMGAVDRPDGGARSRSCGSRACPGCGSSTRRPCRSCRGEPQHHRDDHGREVCGLDPGELSRVPRRAHAVPVDVRRRTRRSGGRVDGGHVRHRRGDRRLLGAGARRRVDGLARAT